MRCDHSFNSLNSSFHFSRKIQFLGWVTRQVSPLNLMHNKSAEYSIDPERFRAPHPIRVVRSRQILSPRTPRYVHWESHARRLGQRSLHLTHLTGSRHTYMIKIIHTEHAFTNHEKGDKVRRAGVSSAAASHGRITVIDENAGNKWGWVEELPWPNDPDDTLLYKTP